MERRTFLRNTGLATVGIVASSATYGYAKKIFTPEIMESSKNSNTYERMEQQIKSGFGGVALGNGFNYNSDIQCLQTMESAWNAGVRLYDTSPWYGLGISERRMGLFLKDKKREDFVLSTKVGRILYPHEDFKITDGLWKGRLNFSYTYDYTAAGVRKSIEDSLQRLGVSSLDIVFIHDLSPDNGDMKEGWVHYFDIAAKGAMPELTKMREEGLIKGWGFGVNTIEPVLKAIEVADPDVFLSACQYSLIHHKDDLHQVFPKVAERGISILVGAPLCAGFLAGKDRYLYGGDFPLGVKEKLAALQRVVDNHQVDLRTAALQFCAAPTVVSGVVPGASNPQQAQENAASFAVSIPADFWRELKHEGLIDVLAPVPDSV